jgi:hypothetical protein
MPPQANPEAGWYPDPVAPGQLRLWDGEGWTPRTKPWNPEPTNPGPTKPVPAADPHRRRRMAVEGAGLVVMMLVAGFPALPSWATPARPATQATAHRSGSTAPGSASTTTTTPPVTVDCRLAAARPGPARVIEWFSTHGLTATPAATPDLPPGACAVAAFTDSHAPGQDVVVVYPDAQSAVVAASTPVVPALTMVQGIYMVALDPSLTGVRGDYQAALVNYVAASNPVVVPPSSTSTTAPAVNRGGGSRSRGSGRG